MHRPRLRSPLLTLAALLGACPLPPANMTTSATDATDATDTSDASVGGGNTMGTSTSGGAEPTTGGPTNGATTGLGATEDLPDTGEAAMADGRICVVDRDDRLLQYASLQSDDPTVQFNYDFQQPGCFGVTGPAHSEVVARASAPGYVESGTVLPLGEGGRVALIRLAMAPFRASFDAAEPATLKAGPVTVSIPAHAVIDPDTMQPITGKYDLVVLPIDPTKDLAYAPGPLVGLTEGGELFDLESYMMSEISLWQTDLQRPPKRLQLDSKIGATLKFVISTSHPRYASLEPGQTIKPWFYDLAAGRWVEDGSPGVLVPSGDGLTWVAHVSHFTYWNADFELAEKECVKVKVLIKNPNNMMWEPVSESVPVTVRGKLNDSDGYAGFDTAYTEKGETCVEIPIGRKATVYAGTIVQPLLGSDEVSIVGTNTPSDCQQNPAPGQEVTIFLHEGLCMPGKSEPCFPYGDDLVVNEQPSQCESGDKVCLDQFWSGCSAVGPALVENCDDALDNDCDGDLFNGCDMKPCEPKDSGKLCMGNVEPYRFDYGDPAICTPGTTKCQVVLTCVGVVDPDAEVLNNTLDEDCDGWPAKEMKLGQLAGPSDQVITSMAATADSLYVTGFHEAPIQVGNQTIPHKGGTAVFVARFDHDLHLLAGYSVATFPPGNSIPPPRLAVDEAGEPYLVGYCSVGGVTIGGMNQTCAAAGQAFFADLKPDLSAEKIRVFGGPDLKNLDIAAAQKKVYMIGDAELPFDFAGSPVAIAGDGDAHAFLLAYDLVADSKTATLVPGLGITEARRLAIRLVNGVPQIHMAGSFSGSLAINGQDIPAGSNMRNGFVAKYDPNGAKFVGAAGVLGSDNIDIRGLALPSDGRVVVAGSFKGSILQAGHKPPPAPPVNLGGPDVFVARFALDPQDMSTPDVRSFDDPSYLSVQDVALIDDDVLVTGGYAGNLGFGGLPLKSTAPVDGFLVRLSKAPALPHQWTRALAAGPSPVMGRALSVFDSELFVAASFAGTLDLDVTGGPVNLVPEFDGALIRLSAK